MNARAAVTAIICALTICGCGRDDSVEIAPPPKVHVEAEMEYALVKTLESGMEELYGMALDSADRIYLAGRGGVRVLDAEGAELRRLRAAEPARCVAVDPEGNVYVGLRAKVQTYDRGGNLLTSWGTEGKGPGQFGLITALAVSDSSLYVADYGNRVVHRFAVNGDYVSELGGRDPEGGAPGIVAPSPHLDVAVDAEGVVHVNNPGRLRVERHSPDGELLAWWGRAGTRPEDFYGCCNPTDIALLPGGRTVTSEKGIGITRVKVYDPDGRMLAYIGPEHFARSTAGLDLAVDSQERIYVADSGDGKVHVFQLVE
jgi:sugar lactone lactonase YvrE